MTIDFLTKIIDIRKKWHVIFSSAESEEMSTQKPIASETILKEWKENEGNERWINKGEERKKIVLINTTPFGADPQKSIFHIKPKTYKIYFYLISYIDRK